MGRQAVTPMLPRSTCHPCHLSPSPSPLSLSSSPPFSPPLSCYLTALDIDTELEDAMESETAEHALVLAPLVLFGGAQALPAACRVLSWWSPKVPLVTLSFAGCRELEEVKSFFF